MIDSSDIISIFLFLLSVYFKHDSQNDEIHLALILTFTIIMEDFVFRAVCTKDIFACGATMKCGVSLAEPAAMMVMSKSKLK